MRRSRPIDLSAAMRFGSEAHFPRQIHLPSRRIDLCTSPKGTLRKSSSTARPPSNETFETLLGARPVDISLLFRRI